jgi:hypothetical protein
LRSALCWTRNSTKFIGPVGGRAKLLPGPGLWEGDTPSSVFGWLWVWPSVLDRWELNSRFLTLQWGLVVFGRVIQLGDSGYWWSRDAHQDTWPLVVQKVGMCGQWRRGRRRIEVHRSFQCVPLVFWWNRRVRHSGRYSCRDCGLFGSNFTSPSVSKI